MSLSLDKIVKVSASIEDVGALRRVFGIGLFITTDTTLGTVTNKVEVYANFSEIAARFAEGTAPYKAGVAWFSQSPFPRNLIIARWYNVASAGRIIGGKITDTVSVFSNLTNTGAVSTSIDGTTYSDISVDLTGVTSFAGVALVVQNALTNAGAGVTVVFDSLTSGFVVESTSTGESSSVSAFTSPTTHADIGILMKLSSNTITQLDLGVNAQTLPEALVEIKTYNDSWYFVDLDNDAFSVANVISLSENIEATGNSMYTAQSGEQDILTSGETTTSAYQLFVKQPQRTFMTYSASDDYKGLSIAARLSSINFNANNSIVTAKFKSLPEMTPDIISETQVSELERKRVNYYTKFATDAIYAEGYCFNNSVFIDVRYSLDWFVNATRVSVYDLLRASNVVAQTTEGETIVLSTIDSVCRQAKSNGMIAGGTVSDAMKNDIIETTGDSTFDGVLHKGYLVWSQPTSAQDQASRSARKGTAKKVWLKGSGAIHFADIGITFEN